LVIRMIANDVTDKMRADEARATCDQ